MKRKRRTFARNYKLAAVKKVVEQGLSFSEVARDLDTRDTLPHNLRKSFEADRTLQTEVNQSPSVETDLKRLRKENRQLKMERDILKKRRLSLSKKTVGQLRFNAACLKSHAVFYKWIRRKPTATQEKQKLIASEIKRIHALPRHQDYGSPRMHRELVSQGVECSERNRRHFLLKD